MTIPSSKVDRSLLNSKSLDLETKILNLKIILSELLPNLDSSNIRWDGKMMGSKIYNIFCKTHPTPPKIWEPYLNNLLKGHSCSACANEKNGLRQRIDFIADSRKKHGEERFDYSNTKYLGYNEDVIIRCVKHNKEFKCNAATHLSDSRSAGCPSCLAECMSGEHHHSVVSLDELKRRIESIWGNRFEYDFTGYTCLGDYIKITCKECKRSWKGTATNHVHPTEPRGCIKCGRKVCADKLRLTYEEFVSKCVETHGTKYDYSKFIYVTNSETGIVICKIHGEYQVTPADHFGGTECPQCSLAGVSKGQLQWLSYCSSKDALDIIYKGGKHNREETFKINGKLYRADGYSSNTNTIYEFLGCWYHGCNKCGKFVESRIHPWKNMTMKELNEEFQQRKRVFEENGYIVVFIWECEWNAIKTNYI